MYFSSQNINRKFILQKVNIALLCFSFAYSRVMPNSKHWSMQHVCRGASDLEISASFILIVLPVTVYDFQIFSVAITNKMQLGNGIYYSTIH